MPTVVGPGINPWNLKGIATLKGGTNDIETKSGVRIEGFMLFNAIAAITNKAPFTGAPTAPVIIDAVANCDSSGGVTFQNSNQILFKNGNPRNNISENQTTARHQKRN